jgi:hypothetical protein
LPLSRRIDVLGDLIIEKFPVLASVFRTSSKYQIPRLRDDVLGAFLAAWPSSLPEHISNTNAFKAKLQTHITAPNGARVPNPRYDPGASDALIVHPASVIALLREGQVDDATLLAPLFYDLFRRTWQLGPPFSGYHLRSLPPTDVERLMYGAAALRTAHARMASTPPNFDFPTFAHGNTHAQHHSFVTTHWTEAIIPRLLHDLERNLLSEPIEDWETARAEATAAFSRIAGDCLCRQQTLDYMARCQQSLWDNLGTYFALK